MLFSLYLFVSIHLLPFCWCSKLANLECSNPCSYRGLVQVCCGVVSVRLNFMKLLSH